MRTIETWGAKLLGKFVPSVEASAGCTPKCYASCWQCGGSACIQYADCSINCL